MLQPKAFAVFPVFARTRPHWEGTTSSSVCCLRYVPLPKTSPLFHLHLRHLFRSLFARAFSVSSEDSFPLIAIEHSPICTAFANSNRRRSHSSGNQLSPDLDTFSPFTSSRVASSGPAPTFRFDLFPRTTLITRHCTTSSRRSLHRTTTTIAHCRLPPRGYLVTSWARRERIEVHSLNY